MTWMISENKLDEQQRMFLERKDLRRQNFWIRGFPGSGKSVLLAYRLKYIQQLEPNAAVVVVVFTHSLIAMFKAAFAEMGCHPNAVLTMYQFMDKSYHYNYALCDEIQDFPPTIVRALYERCDHVVAAGDENQSIYDVDPKYREATVTPSQIQSLLQSTPFELTTIHRLTRNIIEAVKRFFPALNVFASKADATKGNTEIRLCHARDEQTEVKYVYGEALKYVERSRQSVGILLTTQQSAVEFMQQVLDNEGKPHWKEVNNQWGKPNFDAFNNHVSQCGLPMQYVGNGYGKFDSGAAKINVMTYHSSKCLDFDVVFLPGLTPELGLNGDSDTDKRVFLVGMTRSRDTMYLTYTGSRPHAYVQTFAQGCSAIECGQAPRRNTSSNIFGDI